MTSADSDWDRIRREKEAHRAVAAARPFEEKVRILERMRTRSEALSAWRRPSAGERVGASGSLILAPRNPEREATTGHLRITTPRENLTLVAAARPAVAVGATPVILVPSDQERS